MKEKDKISKTIQQLVEYLEKIGNHVVRIEKVNGKNGIYVEKLLDKQGIFDAAFARGIMNKYEVYITPMDENLRCAEYGVRCKETGDFIEPDYRPNVYEILNPNLIAVLKVELELGNEINSVHYERDKKTCIVWMKKLLHPKKIQEIFAPSQVKYIFKEGNYNDIHYIVTPTQYYYVEDSEDKIYGNINVDEIAEYMAGYFDNLGNHITRTELVNGKTGFYLEKPLNHKIIKQAEEALYVRYKYEIYTTFPNHDLAIKCKKTGDFIETDYAVSQN